MEKKSTDSPQTDQVGNIGNSPLEFSVLSYPQEFPLDSANQECTLSSVLAGGQRCALIIDFLPTAPVALHESVSLTDNPLNVSQTQQQIQVNGTGYEVLLSATSLTYGPQVLNTESASQQVTLTNTTGAPLRISSIFVTGVSAPSFTFASDCPAALQIGA